MNNKKKDNLYRVHKKFLESIKDVVIGEILVGSTVYAEEENLTENSDLDITCIVDKTNLPIFLNTLFLKNLIDQDVAKKILDEGKADYLVLKKYLDGILLSIDVITPDFFNKMCNLDLTSQTETFNSYKYGNEPQVGFYTIKQFDGTVREVQKVNTSFNSGNLIKLPLFFISKERKYMYGIPTVKYLTYKIFYDPQGIIKEGISNIYKNIIRRLLFEYPSMEKEKYDEYFLNLFKGKDKFPLDYKEKILKDLEHVICMEKNEILLKNLKKEVYSFFKDNQKNEYTNPDWIFPNHLDIMEDLVKEMCTKYNGDIFICQLAVLLHDVGLVYKREGNSSEGHEERSVEYAKNIFVKYKIPTNISEEVIKCINSTEKDSVLKQDSINQKILRTADVLSQFISVHYFAKASFFNNWDFFIKWMKDRIESCYNKISFESEKELAKPIKEYLLNAIKLYELYNKNYLNKEKIGEQEKNDTKNH